MPAPSRIVQVALHSFDHAPTVAEIEAKSAELARTYGATYGREFQDLAQQLSPAAQAEITGGKRTPAGDIAARDRENRSGYADPSAYQEDPRAQLADPGEDPRDNYADPSAYVDEKSLLAQAKSAATPPAPPTPPSGKKAGAPGDNGNMFGETIGSKARSAVNANAGPNQPPLHQPIRPSESVLNTARQRMLTDIAAAHPAGVAELDRRKSGDVPPAGEVPLAQGETLSTPRHGRTTVSEPSADATVPEETLLEKAKRVAADLFTSDEDQAKRDEEFRKEFRKPLYGRRPDIAL